MSGKSSRKFRAWDNNVLFQTYQQALQIKQTIEHTCIENQIDVTDMPNSVLETNNLYTLAAAYETVYRKLLDEELLKCGFLPNPSKSYH